MAFYWCGNLTTIEMDKANRVYAERDGVLFNKAFTELVRFPAGKTVSSYAVPDGVTTIGDSAFSGCRNLNSVTIPTGLTTIENDAFFECIGLVP
jgi:hypothetical protein